MTIQTAIKVENVSKFFRLGQFISFSSMITNFKGMMSVPENITEQFDKKKRIFTSVKGDQYLAALHGINFEIKKGEKVGIVGINGAGKSSLLKILIGIMKPTEGTVNISGRVIPLLGLSTGFNNELTGYENIFINASIFGLSKEETLQKLPAIEEFSEIAEFFDTPIKRYSKGMRARLGISIAANLEPDILIVDEVLAVGDLKFKQKCMERMAELSEKGMTLIFVSHSPARIRRLCERAILVRDGTIAADGLVDEVLQKYISEDLALDEEDMFVDEDEIDTEEYAGPDIPKSKITWNTGEELGDEVVRLISVECHNKKGELTTSFMTTEEIHVKFSYKVLENCENLRSHINFFNALNGSPIFSSIENLPKSSNKSLRKGTFTTTVKIDSHFFNTGDFMIGVNIASHDPLNKHMRAPRVLRFEVTKDDSLSSVQSDYPRELPGFICPKLLWSTEKIEK